ncbi:hypothetical protein ACVW00_004297 [Marmoricola sp. URHA0025 HA25]
MIGRRLLTGATLMGLVVVVCVMAVWGYHAATAPIGDTSSGSSSDGPTCAPQDQTVTKYVRRSDVTVSVYNAGERAGRAQETMDLLEHAGFKPGEVNNAPDGVEAQRAAVYSTKDDDPAAELVAKALGKKTQVVHSDEALGPGVDVVIGDRFKGLDAAAPTRLALPKPETSCK